MRRTSLLVCALAVVLSLAVPSAATPPVSYREVFVQSDPVALLPEPTCDGFDVLWTATADHRWTDLYDRDGELTLTTLHCLFNGTLYDSTDLSKTLAYQGGGFWEFDAQPVSDLSTYHSR